MEKTRYSELRKENNFIFRYYLEEKGKIMDEGVFKFHLKNWMAQMGVQWRSGITMIVKHLDDKYQYSR